MTAKIGVAVSGLGIGEQHARAFAADSRAQLLWLHDLDRGRAEKLARELPGSRVATSFEQIIGDPAVHAVSIATFDNHHFEQASAALRAGKHVFIEKPLCTSREELAQLRNLWSAGGGRLKLGSNLILRAAPLYQWLKRELAGGALGSLYAFDGEYLYGRLHKITEGWRSGIRRYSVMLGGGIHLVDLMLWITGERPLRVNATGNRVVSRGTSFDSDDFRTATFEFESGLIGRIAANFGCVHRHQHVMRLYGTRATFLYDDAGARMYTVRDPGEPPRAVAAAPLPQRKGDLIPPFLDAIAGVVDYSAETLSFLDGISICLAADEAAETGRAVTIDYT